MSPARNLVEWVCAMRSFLFLLNRWHSSARVLVLKDRYLQNHSIFGEIEQDVREIFSFSATLAENVDAYAASLFKYAVA